MFRLEFKLTAYIITYMRYYRCNCALKNMKNTEKSINTHIKFFADANAKKANVNNMNATSTYKGFGSMFFIT